MAYCPMDIFLEHISDEERALQKLASGESIQDIVREFQKAGYKSKQGAKEAVLRRLATEVRIVLGRIFREEGELYSVPILESLKERALKRRSRVCRAKAWWYRRRKDSVFVTVGDRRGAVRRGESWKLNYPGATVPVQFPDGKLEWVPVVARS